MKALIEIMRMIAVAIACWNMWWSFRGVLDLARGHFWPPSFYLAVVFWIGTVTFSFQLSHFFGVTDLWRLLSYTLLILALGLAAIGHHQGFALKAGKFYGLYDHLDEAQAIAGLALIDPSAAERIAAECRKLTAAAIVAQRG